MFIIFFLYKLNENSKIACINNIFCIPITFNNPIKTVFIR